MNEWSVLEAICFWCAFTGGVLLAMALMLALLGFCSALVGWLHDRRWRR